MFERLEVILGYFPACREVQALLIAMQLCAHCPVPAATVGSFDSAPKNPQAPCTVCSTLFKHTLVSSR